MCRLDVRAVTAKVPKDDLAMQIQQLDAALKAAKIVISKINILQLENVLQFGTYNSCPKKTSEVNKMITSFEKHGIQAFKDMNTLLVMIERMLISPNENLEGSWNQSDKLTHVKFEDMEPIILALGQHQVAELKKMMNTLLEDNIVMSKWIKHLEGMNVISDEGVEEYVELHKHLTEVKGKLSMLGQ
ncbi:hypothetical protein BDR05DRAFT_947607 [Suillus weaverae]|nr:hypothetical protein BDR05DRAFT_947607 [Suillus weaverae]